MKYSVTTYKNIENRQIGLTANNISRPYKVLFFGDTHILFLKGITHFVHWQVAPSDPQTKTWQRVQLL